ncbi:Cystatin domain containing protein [Trema orientale]|uniref:Cystatin domain containing protein n=1 Tax=Trema orientale TaxID=63057 RepID=A0A2P5F5N5_TREOI|nr:Cystatin domain containing protein [Trema orientale]
MTTHRDLDDDEYHPSTGVFSTNPYLAAYSQQVEASEGFYLDYDALPSKCRHYATFRPVPPTNERVVAGAHFGLGIYNANHRGSNLRLARIVRANSEQVAGMMYYITLQATDGCFYELKLDEGVAPFWTRAVARELLEIKCSISGVGVAAPWTSAMVPTFCFKWRCGAGSSLDGILAPTAGIAVPTHESKWQFWIF